MKAYLKRESLTANVSFMCRGFTLKANTDKKRDFLESYSKGQFSEIRYISKEVCRIFVFVDTNAVLVRKNRWAFGGLKKLPCV